MATAAPVSANGSAANGTNGTSTVFPSASGAVNGTNSVGTFNVKAGLAQMLKGGVIMDVMNAEQGM